MEDVKENFKKYVCIFCSEHKCENNYKCMNIKKENKNNILTYKCCNFKKKFRLEPEFIKFIKYTYYEENGDYIAIINTNTPIDIINKMKTKFDEVRFRESYYSHR